MKDQLKLQKCELDDRLKKFHSHAELLEFRPIFHSRFYKERKTVKYNSSIK
jgi:hypothetical protein